MIINIPNTDGSTTEVLDGEDLDAGDGLGSLFSKLLSRNKNSIGQVAGLITQVVPAAQPYADAAMKLTQQFGNKRAAGPAPQPGAQGPDPQQAASASTPSGVPFGYIAVGGVLLGLVVLAMTLNKGRRG